MDPKELPVKERIKILVESLDGAESTNEALSSCQDSDAMLDVLLDVSTKLRLGLTRDELMKTPPIRDWVWWKNKQALVTLGDGNLRHQQDSSSKTRWDSWTLDFFKLLKIRL